jgi:hypothetical protein
MTLFQTNKRLWLVLTLAVWAPWLFLWRMGKTGDDDTPASIVWYLLREFFRDGMSLDRFEEFVGFIIFVIILPLLAAAIIAWVIHCPIIMLLSKRKKATPTAHL